MASLDRPADEVPAGLGRHTAAAAVVHTAEAAELCGLSDDERMSLLSGLKSMEADMMKQEARRTGSAEEGGAYNAGVYEHGSHASHAAAAYNTTVAALAGGDAVASRDIAHSTAKTNMYDPHELLSTLSRAAENAAHKESERHLNKAMAPGGTSAKLKQAEEHLRAAMGYGSGPGLESITRAS